VLVMPSEGAQMLRRSADADMKLWFPLAVLSLGLSMLGGCDSAGKMAELEQYVREVKARPAKPIEPLPEIRPYATYAYDAVELRDPFEPLRVTENETVAEVGAGAGGGGVSPDVNRQKELLEFFPLDSLRMVGILEREGVRWALVQSTDKAIHRIREGNYLGQNFGKVTHVSEQQIDLVEIVPNGQGGWMERQAQLAMKE